MTMRMARMRMTQQWRPGRQRVAGWQQRRQWQGGSSGDGGRVAAGGGGWGDGNN